MWWDIRWDEQQLVQRELIDRILCGDQMREVWGVECSSKYSEPAVVIHGLANVLKIRFDFLSFAHKGRDVHGDDHPPAREKVRSPRTTSVITT